MRPRNPLSKFLRSSLESRLRLSATQIYFIEGRDLTDEEVFECANKAEWRVAAVEVQNNISIYHLVDPCFVCGCGLEPDHFHENNEACCGDSDCCPDAMWAEPPDIEVEIAWNVGQIRQRFIK
jgi:hypothetical protein